MRCPYCSKLDNKVIDSRLSKDGRTIRRRRECIECERRFTTYEKLEEVLPMVIKKDGRREPFSRDKIIGGIKKACQKRPVSITKIDEFVDSVELYFQELGKKEIDSKEIGERVINRLKEWDEVAYVRFASVYRQFRDINEFMAELEGILKTRKEKEGTKKSAGSREKGLTGQTLKDRHEKFMKAALGFARKGLGKTSPNPAVGAVIARRGQVVAAGFHRKAGGAHAEVEALNQLRGKARRGDTLYVTLEPCNHFGRTPPCTQAILERGIRKVVVGMRDPNPHVTGGGCDYLSGQGVEVVTGVLEEECRRLNEWFVTYVTKGRPFVIAKTALTLDGWTATSTGHSRWVTNEQSREWVHRLRHQVDGILVGVGTVMADDPLLNTRLKKGRGKDPVRIIVDTHLRIPVNARVLAHPHGSETLIAVSEDVPSRRIERLKTKGISFLVCPKKEGRIDLTALMDMLGNRSIASVLLEGGATLMGAMIREKLVDKFCIFKAPKILGGSDGRPMALGQGPSKMDQSIPLKDIRIKRFGDDLLITGYPEYS
ncbi:MAG: bifunctional diaminohydroxyphosphoribosylaminopyrimidine deaminase/5-amino-6-(5-phosphoribosylamino)uracil reductase RibD [Deltaproteobacteria bacterium]|nr:bifunctional diaminohydroxyphosphoribosylaminopyrimidine deaminase/5-amino-6-(5-phosphoribosylamino)uracil reductase RibD [Deltaproteobacteria bacterium]